MSVVKPDNSRKIITTVLLLLLSSLACTQAVVTATPTTPVTTPTTRPTMTPTASPAPLIPVGRSAIVKRVSVYVHTSADAASDIVGSVSGGDVVVILECVSDWCRIKAPSGWIWRGCLSGNDDLGCEAKQ